MRWWVGPQYTTQGLVNDIEARKNKISILDMTAFSYEHDTREQNNKYKNLLFERID